MIQKFLKTKQAKAALIAIAVIAVLAAAFFAQPSANKESVSSDTGTSSDELTPTVPDRTTETVITDIPASSSSEENKTAGSKISTDAAAAKTATVTTASTVTSAKTEPATEPPHTVTISVRCDTILNNLDKFDKNKLSILPPDGVIMNARTVSYAQGESVFDVLKREAKASKIHFEFSAAPAVYIEGIGNIYEFDCGPLSGWSYKVNGLFPDYGCGKYTLKDWDVIELVYSCDLGRDIGGGVS